MAANLAIRGTLRAAPNTTGDSVAGFRLSASVTRLVPVADGDPTTIPIVCTGGGIADAQGAFAFDLGGDGEPRDPVTIVVATPDGTQVDSSDFTLQDVAQPLTIDVVGLPPLLISPTEAPERGSRIPLLGRVLDESGRGVPAGLPVVLWGIEEANDPPQPIVITKTTSGGYFSGDWVSTRLHSAFGRISGAGDTSIRLEDERLPRRVLLVMPLPPTEARNGGPPRRPEPAELTDNPAAFSQDLGRGCVQLSVPNRAIEEFVYTQVVRTSEPEVKGLTLGTRRRKVPADWMAPLVEAAVMHEAWMTGRVSRRDTTDLANLSLDVHTARMLADGDHPPSLDDIQRAAWLSEVNGVRELIGAAVTAPSLRQPLDADHPIDWDETPTVYQAITIARGHLLEFREVWRADGYSLGDLLHSLPLAPGQRRQVAILDWERRTTSSREESLEYEEELESLVGRDRDISEIVGSRLAEESAGASKNTTWGVAGGVGGGFIAGAWGVFGGVAGSASGSTSTAWQDSSRQFSADSLQSLRDRVMQRASSVRDERSTVVETVAQGETLRAETETVANYNHCHAMTIEYFEVLRHFIITHELANVRECLFVPMAMSSFTQAKALRWQTPLTTHLKDRALVPGFDAMRRIADNWEGWDYPVSRYSEEAPQVLEGELRISFVLPRPRDSDDGKFQVDMWKAWLPYLWMAPLELWAKHLATTIAEYNAAEIARRDAEFRRIVAPELARRIMDRLRFAYITTDGSEREVSLDATLVSSYAEGVPLYVTLRASGGLPPIPREQIAQFQIRLDGAVLPPDAQLVVHSGRMRYQTEHKRWLLFDDDRILNDLANADPVFVPTPTTWPETVNPRQEDRDLATRLVAHLNAAIEFYHQAIWMWLDPERRFMLLDGILVPGLGGRSVASVVENRLIGIAGNSLIFPLAPGLRLDPRVSGKSKGDLIDLYEADAPPPVRVSVPTRGVYAEAVLGACNACEEIDDSRYWRWTTAGMLAPPTIEPVTTASRATPEEALKATPLPTPLVSIQNAPELPNPVGLGEVFNLLARSDTFTDITGLAGTQKNARAAFDAAMSSTSGIASQAAQLASQNIANTAGERMLDRILTAQSDGLLSADTAQQLSEKVFGSMLGAPNANAQTKADSPLADPTVQKALDQLSMSDTGTAKVSTNDETIEMKFDGGDVMVGAAQAGLLDIDDNFVPVDVILETAEGEPGLRTWKTVRISDKRKIPLLADWLGGIPESLLRTRPGQNVSPLSSQSVQFDILSRLRIQFPSDPGKPKELAKGTNRLPVVFIVPGHSGVPFFQAPPANHHGFGELQDSLARVGFVSVAVDTNVANIFNAAVEMRAEILLAAIKKMKDLNDNPASTFHKRLNFDRVGLLGHSRGGDAVVRALLINLQRKLCQVMVVVLVAPTDVTGTFRPATVVGEYGTRMDMDTITALLVIQGGLDGDVSGFKGVPREVIGTGFGHYDRCTVARAHVYIPLATHNRFNSTWSDEKWLLPQDAQRALGKPEHAGLLNFYGATALRIRTTGMPADALDILSGKKANPFAIEASLLWGWGPDRDLDDFEGPDAIVGTRTIHDATIERFEDVQFGTQKLWAHVPHHTSVLTIGANLTGVSPFALELSFAAPENWRDREFLNVDLGTSIDLTSMATVAAGVAPPWVTVSLEDGQGNVKAVDLRKFTPVGSTSRPLFHEVWKDPGQSTDKLNCTLLRLETCSIPLKEFTGLDLRSIRRLQVLPPASLPQLIFIDSIRVGKRRQ